MATKEVLKSEPPTPAHPMNMLDALRGEMDRIFKRFERGWPRWPLPTRGSRGELMVPALDVHDNARQISIEVDLPGVDEKDVSVTLSNGVLRMKDEKKHEREEKDETHYMCERSFGTFERSVRLPDSVDESKLEARFDKGVLHIVARKRPEALKAETRIAVKSAESDDAQAPPPDC